jgi:RNA-directed DNA polymerase
MENWSAHQLFRASRVSLGDQAAQNLWDYSHQIKASGLPVIFTLGHLAKITDINYKFLWETVARRREVANYKIFWVSKRAGGRRYIHSVTHDLHRVQQFINTEILQNCKPHPASFAFHRNGGIRSCATEHCGARWIFQFDLADFFYSINEQDIYSEFLRMGYRSLLAFELARICTTIHVSRDCSSFIKRVSPNPGEYYNFYRERLGRIGILPQGAASSPMLSNLVARKLDEELSDFSRKRNFVYTRYADDLTFSCSGRLSKSLSVGYVCKEITRIIRNAGFRENKEKIRVSGPGSKKTVLGLLVDGNAPKISRETWSRTEQIIYAVEKFGLQSTASARGFDSPIGLKNHICGLLAYIKDVDEVAWIQLHGRWTNASASEH